MKYVVVLGDGMADEPISVLGGKTPLETAVTPHLDRISKMAEIGMVHTIPEGMKPGLIIFALFSTLNIIVPLIFGAVPLSDKWCVVVACCSIGLLGLGLLSTFLFLAQMLKWKEKYD